MAKGFVYRGANRSVETVVRKSKQSGGTYDSYLVQEAQMYKPKEGECTVRILPPTWEDTEKWGDNWDISIWVHYGIGADDAAYLCLDKMLGKPCPACEARAETTDEDERDALRPSLRPMCYVVDRDAEKTGPQPWPMPITLFREINARSIDKKTNAPILIDDPEEGFDILINRTGTKVKTKNTAVEIIRESTPLHDDQKLEKRWLDFIQANPLPDLLNYYPYEHISKVLLGRVDKSTPKDEDEPAPRSTRRGRAESELEEEEDAPPPRNARRGRAEPEPEPEEEEDAPPPRNARRGRAEPEVEEEDPPFEPDPPRSSSRRKQLLDEDEGEPEETSTVGAARRSLERLKPAGRRG